MTTAIRNLFDPPRTPAPRADRRRDRQQLRHRARNGGRARAEGAKLILAGRNGERLRHAALELDAHRRSPRVHEGARARPSQPHRRRLRRHTVVGITPR
jgi:hypothetical protein